MTLLSLRISAGEGKSLPEMSETGEPGLITRAGTLIWSFSSLSLDIFPTIASFARKLTPIELLSYFDDMILALIRPLVSASSMILTS